MVVLNWNGRHHLGPCLDSLLAVDYPAERLEIIVVDNGSTDGSAEFLATSYPTVRVLRNDRNLGYALPNNQGARASEADYVAILNNDTRVDRNWLRPLVDYLEANPRVLMAGSLVLDWDGKKVDFMRSGMSAFGEGFQLGFGKDLAEAPARPEPQLFVNGAGFLARRAELLEMGGFDERYFAYYEDVDLGWRAWVLGWEVMLVPESRVYHRHHGTSSRFGFEKLDLLFARNAMMSVIKNYEDATLDRLLPIMLLAQFKRIERMASIPSSTFRFSPDDPSALLAATLPRDEGRGRNLREWLIGVRAGVVSPRHEVAKWLVKIVQPGAMVYPRFMAARFTAMSDVLDAWPDLMERRRWIQERRRRPDAEIEPLFRLEEQQRSTDPPYHAAREYTEAWIRAAEAEGLGTLVPRGLRLPDPKPAPERE